MRYDQKGLYNLLYHFIVMKCIFHYELTYKRVKLLLATIYDIYIKRLIIKGRSLNGEHVRPKMMQIFRKDESVWLTSLYTVVCIDLFIWR